MRIYRETMLVTATASTITFQSSLVPSGFYRIYEGRVVENQTAARGTFAAYLGAASARFRIGAADLITATNNPAEESGHRHYYAGEYWTFTVSGLTTGDVIGLDLMGMEITVFEYEKGVIPT